MKDKCVLFSFFLTEKKLSPEDSTDVIPTGRQIAISRLTGRGGGLFIPSQGMPALVRNRGQETSPRGVTDTRF